MIGTERERWLRRLPGEWRDGDRVALVHAVPGDTWKGVLPDAADEELRWTYGPLAAAIAVYCHIHRPYVRSSATSPSPTAAASAFRMTATSAPPTC